MVNGIVKTKMITKQLVNIKMLMTYTLLSSIQ